MSDVNCPYCDASLSINHDDGYGYDENVIFHQTCKSCRKVFTYTTVILFSYEAETSECLNGGEHSWEEERGELNAGVEECTDCGEVKVDNEKHEKAIKEYFERLK
jgi:hypothetical protein